MTREEALTLRPGDFVAFTDDSCAWLGYTEGAPIEVHHVEPRDTSVKIWLDFGSKGVKYTREERLQRHSTAHVNDLLRAFTQ